MRFLANHFEKVLCVAIVAFCSVWAYMSLGRELPIRPAALDFGALHPAAPSGDLSSYRYHPSRLAPYAEQFEERLRRGGEPLTCAYTQGTFYPRPVRPEVTVVVSPPPPPRVLAEFPAFNGLQADGGHGKVAIGCLQPARTKDFVPVRIEVQRGPSPEAFEHTIHCFECMSVSEHAASESSPEKPTTEVRAGARRRPGGVRARKDAASPTVALRYVDTDLQADASYCYRARLVCRVVAGGPDGRPLEGSGLGIPPNVVAVPEGTDGKVLYAGLWSSAVRATVLKDLELRYNFVTKGRMPDDPAAPQEGYSVFLGVRLWDDDAQAWGEGSLEVAVGKPVKGRLKFKVGTTTTVRAFDSGMVLESVRRATRLRTEVKKELLTEVRKDEDGEIRQVPVPDQYGNHQWIERPFISEVPTEVAILRAPYTNREIRLVKGLGYEETLPSGVKLVVEGE